MPYDRVFAKSSRVLRGGLVAQIGEPLIGLTVALDGFVPHGGWTHPHAAFAVKCFVHHHRFQCFAVRGDAQNFIFLAFEMAIAPGLNVFCHVFYLRFVMVLCAGGGKQNLHTQYTAFLPIVQPCVEGTGWVFRRGMAAQKKTLQNFLQGLF